LAIIREQFKAYGEPLSLIPLDIWTDLSVHSERQWEIAAWLHEAYARGVDTSTFVVLDDMDCVDGNANSKRRAQFEHRCVLVESSRGLTSADADLAIDILLGQPQTVAAPAIATNAHGGRSTISMARDRGDGRRRHAPRDPGNGVS
jgi:hypothetical protein